MDYEASHNLGALGDGDDEMSREYVSLPMD
jgi:hypothetical protein